jgi:uncharacterized protein
MRHLIKKTLTLCIVTMSFIYTDTAPAQEKKHVSILDIFRVKSQNSKAHVQKIIVKKKRVKKTAKKRVKAKPKTKITTDPAIQLASVKSPKSLNAQSVLIIGDFMANGLASGLKQILENDENRVVIDKTNGSSGLIRTDFYNWNTEIKNITEREKPQAIVVMIGTNDRQGLTVGESVLTVRSNEWLTEYNQRVAEFANNVRKAGVPVLWVGLPPFQKADMNTDILVFNDIYQKNVMRISGKFIDIWDGFSDDQGAFSTSGADYNGQIMQLRTSDGINLTPSGKQKIAFLVEKQLNLLLKDEKKIITLEPTQNMNYMLTAYTQFICQFLQKVGLAPQFSQYITTPDHQKIIRTKPISLLDPAFDGGNELLGAP